MINFLKRSWRSIVLTIIVSAVVFLTVLSLLLNFYWSPKLGEKIKSTLIKSTDSLYAVNFSESSLHIISGELIIENIDLKPDMSVYNRRKQSKVAPNSLYNLKIKRLVIHHLHPLNLYFGKTLDIDQIIVSQPDLHISYEQNRSQDTLIKDKKTPYQLISKVLRSIHINSILLNDVKLSYVNQNIQQNKLELKDLNFSATDLLIDSTTQQSSSRFLYCTDVSASLNNFEGTSERQRYTYNIADLKFSTRTSQLIATGISFKPTNGLNAFFKGNNEDCFSLSLDSLRLNNFDFKAYSKYHTVHASSAKLSYGKFEMFANPAPNDTTIDQSTNFPQLLLRKLAVDVKIDTLVSNSTDVYYTDYGLKSNQFGTVSFNRMSGKIYNITNNKAALQKNNHATANMEAYLINRSKVDVHFDFDLTDDDMPFAYNGSVGTVNLKDLNPVAMPLGMVKISSGVVNEVTFNVKANREVATGTLTALYNDLRIKLLKKNDENGLKKMGIMSLLANTLIIKRDNPFDNEQPRVIAIAYKRRISSSLFSYMWKSILMGIKQTVGYDTQTEQTVKQKISEFKQNKLTHDARKAERLQRRADRQQKREQRRQQKALRDNASQGVDN